jgi:hypothetical protein
MDAPVGGPTDTTPPTRLTHPDRCTRFSPPQSAGTQRRRAAALLEDAIEILNVEGAPSSIDTNFLREYATTLRIHHAPNAPAVSETDTFGFSLEWGSAASATTSMLWGE